MEQLKPEEVIRDAVRQIDINYSKNPNYLGVLLHNGSLDDFSKLRKGLEAGLQEKGYITEEIKGVANKNLSKYLQSKRTKDKKLLFILEHPFSEFNNFPREVLPLLYKINVDACFFEEEI
jgi:hypothetical protein